MNKISLYLAGALSLIGCASAFALDATTLDSVSYTCTKKEPMQVIYVNGSDGKSFAVLLKKGKMIPMAEQPAASGAAYKAIDPKHNYTLVTKGTEATLQDSRQKVLSECKS